VKESHRSGGNWGKGSSLERELETAYPFPFTSQKKREGERLANAGKGGENNQHQEKDMNDGVENTLS